MLFTVPKVTVSLLNLMIMQKSSVDFSNIVNANVVHMEKRDKSGMKQVQDKLLLENLIRQINLQHNSGNLLKIYVVKLKTEWTK